MYQALICSSSGGTVCTIGIFCVYYVSWLLGAAGSQPSLYAQNIPIALHTAPPDDEQISA
jgi:hypothetical protein